MHGNMNVKFGHFLDTAVKFKTVAQGDKFINLLVRTNAIKGNALCTAKLTLHSSFERPP
jgi:hypothetical protein